VNHRALLPLELIPHTVERWMRSVLDLYPTITSAATVGALGVLGDHARQAIRQAWRNRSGPISPCSKSDRKIPSTRRASSRSLGPELVQNLCGPFEAGDRFGPYCFVNENQFSRSHLRSCLNVATVARASRKQGALMARRSTMAGPLMHRNK
jgi:hypothetical protein